MGVNRLCMILIFTIISLPIFAHGPNLGPPLQDQQQEYLLTGTVTDSYGPLPGVHVLIKGTNTGTFSDKQGEFSLTVQSSNTLVFSYIGYKTMEMSVLGRNTLEVELLAEATQLQEVEVNAGYYTVKERERTGSISRVTAKEIGMQPVSNPLAAMQGRMAGVNITQTSGVPGGGFNIQIRGRNSLRLDGNDPLFVVDGVPFASSPLTASQVEGANTASHPLNSINPADLESIEVLKDADATAIYGSRGANGVVLITTKKGQEGKARLNVDLHTGIGQVANTMDLLNTAQYLQMRHEAFANDGVVPTQFNAPDLLLWSQEKETDWQKELIGNTAYTTSIQTSLTGGNAQTSFRIGMGYRKETTVFPKDYHNQRISGSLGLNHTSHDERFQASFNGNYSVDTNTLPSLDLTLTALRLPPNAPEIFSKDGSLNWENSTWTNPYGLLERDYNGQIKTFVGSGRLRYILFNGLNAIVSAGYTSMQVHETQATPQSAFDPAILIDQRSASVSNNSQDTWIVEPQFTYNKTIGNGRLEILLGTTVQNSQKIQQVLGGSGFSSDALLNNLQAATDIHVYTNSTTEYRYRAYFGRLHYVYENRYFINLTGRRDGSSRFGPGNQFANFGAVGAAWVFSREPKVKKALPFLSYGKLRSSYGITGSDQIGDYEYMDLWRPSFYSYAGINGLEPVRPFNPNFGWEVNKKFELALELGLDKDRIQLSGSYYRNRSDNQLVGYPLPGSTGFATVQNNLPAMVQNSGLELDLETTNISSKHFIWKSYLNLTIPKNKLVAYPSIENSAYAQVYTIGKSLSVVKGYRYIGVDPETGVYSFEDIDGDGLISWPGDIQDIGEVTTDFFGGFQNSITYKNWQMEILFQFVKQNGRMPYQSFSLPGSRNNQPEAVSERWQQIGDMVPFQQYSSAFGPSFFAFSNASGSNFNMTDASFLRLRTLSLSYQIPSAKTLKSRLTLYGQNLFTITSYKGLDPGMPGSTSLPALRVFSLGVHITI